MNESSAERQLFKPSEQYKQAVRDTFDRVFMAASAPDRRLDLPVDARYQMWRKGDQIMIAVYLEDAVGDNQKYYAGLVRVRSTDDNFTEVRFYAYFTDTGELQVANEFLTRQQFSELSLSSPYFVLLQGGLQEGFSEAVYTASDLDYLDLLEDLDSYPQPQAI